MKSSSKGALIVLFSSVLYAIISTISKALLNDGLSALGVLGLRYIGAVLIFGLILLFWNRKLFRIEKKDWPALLLLSICLFTNATGYNVSMKFLDMSIAVVLLYTYPAMVAVASVFMFHNRISCNIVIALLLTFGGMLLTLNLFTADIGEISVLGIILVLLGSAGSAAYVLVAKKLTKKYHSLTLNFYTFLFTSLCLGACFPFVDIGASLSTLDMCGIILTAFVVAGAFFCYTLGIKYLLPSKAAIICSSEPAFGIIFAAVLLGETITLSQGLGAILVISAIVILQFNKE
ncbi:MAG: DMT family transporter [Bacillota bacterium]|nr:DMT family transporter [Bacillota bacterium]